MADMRAATGTIGLDPIHVRATEAILFRLYIDKGRGKYCTIEITQTELQQLSKMIGGVIGGSHLKPQRLYQSKQKERRHL